MTIQFERAVPIFRIFSLEKARELYLTSWASRSIGSTVSLRTLRSSCKSPEMGWRSC
jgi:hypothetical protein